MINILKSEFYKVKHTLVFWINLIIPMVYAFIFYLAYRITGLKNFNYFSILQIYFVFIGATIPIISSLIISKLVDMEIDAGNFHNLLTTKSRGKSYMGKLIMIFICLLIFIILSAIFFGLLFREKNIRIFIICVLLIFIGSLFIYMLHLLVSINISGGASIGLGFVETLISFLSLTSLGDKIWYYLPCTWSARLSATYILGMDIDNLFLYKEFERWTFVGIPFTIIIFIISFIWFSIWDVKTFDD